MPQKSLLNRLLDELCAYKQDDPKFLETAIKIQLAYAAKSSKPRAPRKKRVKFCGNCGSDHIECKVEECAEPTPEE